jgi:hypothetical protein
LLLLLLLLKTEAETGLLRTEPQLPIWWRSQFYRCRCWTSVASLRGAAHYSWQALQQQKKQKKLRWSRQEQQH